MVPIEITAFDFFGYIDQDNGLRLCDSSLKDVTGMQPVIGDYHQNKAQY